MRKDMLKSCLETMRFLSRTTDEVMYLCDLDEKKIYFAENYAKKLKISQMGGTEYTLEQMQEFMFSKNGEKTTFKPSNFDTLSEGILFQEYYLFDLAGQSIKIYSTEKLQLDGEGNPLCIIGHVSDIVTNQKVDELRRLYKEENLVDELRRSVKNDFSGFAIYYQPRVEAKSCKICGAEARLRYFSATKGLIPSNQVLPILEQTGLIAKTDRWVLKKALKQCKKWREEIPHFHVNVNLSLIHMKERMTWDQLEHDLAELDLPGEALTLELMENQYMKDHRSFNRLFKKLGKKGIHVAIDNFETGYSSLSYLNNISVDEVKISRRFVDGIQHSAYNYRLLGNLIELAHRAKIRVCCKGLETESELRTLKELHPDIFQGYLFAKPLTVEEFEEAYIQKDSENYAVMRAKEEKYRNLMERKNSIAKEYALYEKMAAVLDGMDEIVYVSDWDSDELLYLNAAGRDMAGAYDYNGRKCYEVIHGKKMPCEFCQKNKAGSENYHVWELDSDYLQRHFLVKNKQIQWVGKTGNLTLCIDITEKEMMSKAASKDPLTGVFNRKAFEEQVKHHMEKEGGRRESALILLDIDNFKMINDNYGHLAGDAVLKDMVTALRSVFREQDLVGRLGGDEFMIFLKNLADREVIADRLQEFQNVFQQGNEYHSTCSMGITTVGKEDFSYIESVNQADIALYRSKEKGKNMFSFYEDLGKEVEIE